MKTVSLSECENVYTHLLDSGRGTENTDVKRDDVLKLFPYSVIVEAAYPEYDEAIGFGEERFGVLSKASEGMWKELWYGKTEYDYGFWEFFFKNQEDCLTFQEEVPRFSVTTDGKKWRTGGENIFVDVA